MQNKIAITGHSSGIGQAIFERYSPNAIGFSRSNGYDISKDMWSIIAESQDCDIFVNNAQSDFSQTELLYALAKNFKGLIVNIGSLSKDWTKGHKPNYKYSIEKTALHKANDQLFWAGVNTCIIHPGYVDTKMARKFNVDKLSVENIVDVFDWIINQSFCIKEISVSTKER